MAPVPEILPAALARLPRSWWFPGLKGVREADERTTYLRFSLDAQPRVPHVDDSLSFLDAEPEKTDWGIDSGDEGQQVRPLTIEGLRAIAGDMPLPEALRRFAARPDLQRRIRSATACYLDLGDVAAPTTSDGVLIHLLSDQQWCRHWLLYADASGHAVVTTVAPVGFELPEAWDEEGGEMAIPMTVPLDGSFDLEVCADSFAEFLYRHWIETEIWFALARGRPVPVTVAPYLQQLRRQT